MFFTVLPPRSHPLPSALGAPLPVPRLPRGGAGVPFLKTHETGDPHEILDSSAGDLQLATITHFGKMSLAYVS